jgi:hypothetical protein
LIISVQIEVGERESSYDRIKTLLDLVMDRLRFIEHPALVRPNRGDGGILLPEIDIIGFKYREMC